jgi:hypothetical protein
MQNAGFVGSTRNSLLRPDQASYDRRVNLSHMVAVGFGADRLTLERNLAAVRASERLLCDIAPTNCDMLMRVKLVSAVRRQA